MSGAWSLDRELIYGYLDRHAKIALETAANALAGRATSLAPVRNLAPGEARRKHRKQTKQERLSTLRFIESQRGLTQEQKARAIKGARKAKIAIHSHREVNPVRLSKTYNSRNRNRAVTKTFEPGPLTTRGRYEAAHRTRTIHTRTASYKVVGGALRDSITSQGVTRNEFGLIVEVEAGIYYAKYVEFPTRRTAAQPFLRPALKDAKSRLPRMVAKEFGKG